MSKQPIQLRVPISADWDAGDRLEVFTDFGTGSLDMDTPLLSRAANPFPGEQPAKPVGLRTVGKGRVGDSRAGRARTGIGQSRVGVTPVGTTPDCIDLEVDVPAAFGPWKFGVRAVDAEGTVQAGGIQEISLVVSGTEPDPPTAFAFNNHDSGSDQVTFDLDWSR